MKKFLTLAATAAMAAMALPVKAEPLWAWSFARDYCDNLTAGLVYKEAFNVAFNETYRVWQSEMDPAIDGGYAGKLIVNAYYKQCPALAKAAWDAHKALNP